ncbi:EamA family transporter [Hwanghaeella grinnelliae]|uniref:EamA family transporter n=1 Tax=Hwanghaeella grinnelliae TaxID=2500179 RepID=A0A437QN18_9PROT|nr:EamA family transporter [Hwanghaeella grinnelliae]RVU35809.1 EamA family transporter [Hwanghaeella grinnelliae]
MPRTLNTDILLTALAPAIWGSTYYVTTEFLPPDYPITVAMLRALPAGLLLLAIVRRLPTPAWLGRVFILGALNFAIFWVMLFITAYRLPGGVGATVGAIQPLVVILLAHVTLGSPIRTLSVVAATAGLGGVALLVLTPDAGLDPIGVVAGLGGAASMALGTVLTRKWRPPVSLLTFTSWQLTAGGLLLLPIALWMEPPLPPLSTVNMAGLAYLGLIGAAFTYVLWFRGIARIEPAAVSTLGFLSPATALTLGWLLLDQQLGPLQILGIAIILASVWISQCAPQRARLATAAP